jgi:hypothetical protein
MRKRVFLHAGMHKTGTTSIQTYLTANRKWLAERDYFVMGDLEASRLHWRSKFGRSANCYRIAHLAIRPDLPTPMRLTAPETLASSRGVDRAIRDLNSYIGSHHCHNIIISSEAFSFLRISSERQRVRQMFSNHQVVPILFFRDEMEWLKSWKSELSKHLDLAEGRSSQLEICNFSERSWLVDYEGIKKFWGKSGKYLSYEDAVNGFGSVIPTFVEALGLDPAQCPSWDEFWLNKGGAKARSEISCNAN